MAATSTAGMHDNLKEQAALKEKEWKEIQQLQMQSLETALRECRKELADEKAKLQELKEHFKYNLRLINDRDAELEKYDSVFYELKTTVQKRDHEISELKMKIDDLKISASKDAKAREEMQLHYQQRLREKQAEFEQYRCQKDAEINAERDALESHKQSVDRRIVELEQDLETQRRELTIGFEEAMRKQEHENRLEIDNLRTSVLAHELKVKLLAKELEMAKAAQELTVRDYTQVEGAQRDLEKQLRQKEWELDDTKAMTSARVAELESKLQHAELVAKRQLEDFERRYSEADRAVKEKDAIIGKLRESSNERERKLQSEIQSMNSKLEESSIRLRQLEWNVKDLEKEKASVSERLQEEISELKLKWESNVMEMSRDTVARDLELNSLRDTDSKLRVELEQRKTDIERYKRELTSAIDRQAALEQSKAQLDLDWQRRYEDLERLQYVNSEDLVRTLTKGRDEALAEVQAKENEISQKDELILLLTTERDQALATLNKHGLMAERSIKVAQEEDQSEIIRSLQRQNDELKQVIRQMRLDMESLGDQLPLENSAQTRLESDEKYNENSKKNSVRKSRHVHIESGDDEPVSDSFSNADGRPRPKLDPNRELAKDSVAISSHIQQLNNTIGALRSERMELTAQLRKNQLRIVHLENTVDQLSKQPREKQVEIDQLQYELNASKRRSDAEIYSLRQRITDLELQVTEARKEADEYYRASVERNTEATALANQLSKMKIELANSNPTINFGAQELLIQQLQDELTRVRQQYTGFKPTNVSDGLSSDNSVTGLNKADVELLREKLRKAVKQISQLVKEKQVLLELGNRLRAELTKNGLDPLSSSHKRMPAVRDELEQQGTQRTLVQQNVQNKLRELEQLQYDLTKQELTQRHKSSQRERPTRSEQPRTSHRSRSRSAGSVDESDSDQPQSILKQKPSAKQTAASRPDEQMQLLTSLSSAGGGDSLHEIWAMMDTESPLHTSRTPRHQSSAGQLQPSVGNTSARGRPQSADSWTVQGTTTNIRQKPSRKKSPVTLQKASNAQSMPARRLKIRNYNVKDETVSAR